MTTEQQAGIDYLTMTVPATDRSYQPWCEDVQLWVESSIGEHNQLKAGGANGYAGVSVGNKFIGYREDGAMLRVSGPSAERAFSAFYRSFTSVTRIDIQVTAWVSRDPVAGLVAVAHQDALIAIKNGTSAAVVASMTTDSRGGATLYIGSRSSEKMFRIYDKHAQTKLDMYRGAIRYELEAKGFSAKRLAKKLHGAGADADKWITATVADMVEARGVRFLGERGAGSAIDLSRQTEESDADRKLGWLKSQVRPTVAWLIEMGRWDDTMVALGLDRHDWGTVPASLQAAGDSVECGADVTEIQFP